MMKNLCAALAAAALLAGPTLAQTDPAVRTADLPDSWLILYNLNSVDSIAWMEFYRAQWGIPEENTLGLNTDPTYERIHRDTFRDEIFTPVNEYLDTHPTVKARIMGILVGYRVPGNCFLDDTHPTLQGGGGWSITNNLTDLSSATLYHRQNPHAFVFRWQGPRPRLTKATLAADTYITARIDAPTLIDAMALTQRARAINLSLERLPATDSLQFDYADPGAVAGDEWETLHLTIDAPTLNDPPGMFPWQPFDSDHDPNVASTVHLSYYRLTGWQSVPWTAPTPGTRIFGYALNSFGATTVRSTTSFSGRFVPNCLFRGQFAAAIGSTAEPFLGNEPDPSTIIWGLSQGWTLSESFFRSNPYRNYMWEMVGDPLLRVPYWFGAAGDCPEESEPDWSAQAASCLAGPETILDATCLCADRDNDHDLDLMDFVMLQRMPLRSGPAGDCDGDGHLAISDIGPAVECLAGPRQPAADTCACIDLDGDHDVDLGDVIILQRRVGK